MLGFLGPEGDEARSLLREIRAIQIDAAAENTISNVIHRSNSSNIDNAITTMQPDIISSSKSDRIIYYCEQQQREDHCNNYSCSKNNSDVVNSMIDYTVLSLSTDESNQALLDMSTDNDFVKAATAAASQQYIYNYDQLDVNQVSFKEQHSSIFDLSNSTILPPQTVMTAASSHINSTSMIASTRSGPSTRSRSRIMIAATVATDPTDSHIGSDGKCLHHNSDSTVITAEGTR